MNANVCESNIGPIQSLNLNCYSYRPALTNTVGGGAKEPAFDMCS